MIPVTAHRVVDDLIADPSSPVLRVSRLLDPCSMIVLRPCDDSGVYCALGEIGGGRVVVYCTDAAQSDGAVGVAGCRRIAETIELAVSLDCPVIGVWDSAGTRLSEGIDALDAMGRVFAAMTDASGVVPQVSVVVGGAHGSAAYGSALADIVVMCGTGTVVASGPDVVRTVTGENTDLVELGGAEVHGQRSGVAHVVVGTEAEEYQAARRTVELLSRKGRIDVAAAADTPDLRSLLPDSGRRAYNMLSVVRAILDAGTFQEFQPKWAPNIVIGLGRLGGGTVGVVANNPLRKGGCLDSLSAEKAARFVRMCDSLGIPLVVLVDVPGYLPGLDQEWGGVVRRGAKLLHAFAECVVPRVTLVLRKSYGGGYIAMNSRALGATRVFAWPEAEIAVMGATAAVRILRRRELAAAAEHERPALEERLAAELERASGGVDRAVELGAVDEVVEPDHSARRLAQALLAETVRCGGHRNIPL